MAEPRSEARARLSAQRLVDAAVELADASGLESLTMRSLATRLGVVPMALYKHVASKDLLIDLMVDLVWSEVEAPQSAWGWRPAMARRAASLRSALRRHPWAIGLMESRMRPGPANLTQHNAMMGCLRESGFSFRNTVHVTSAVDAFVYGFALQERTLPFDSPAESGAVAQAKSESVPEEMARLFPYLLEVVAELGAQGYDFDEEFDAGLALILDGIERLRPEWTSGQG